MNKFLSHPLSGASISADDAGLAAAAPGRDDATLHDRLRAGLALQSRRIAALERALLRHEAQHGGVSSPVTLSPVLSGAPAGIANPRRPRRHDLPWWPARTLPATALTPPAGSMSLPPAGDEPVKVLAFALFGLDDGEIAREVARIARQQMRQGGFHPVFLTSSPEHAVFRRHGYAFEYFPGLGDEPDLAALQPRLELVEYKWGVDLFVNLGHPKGEAVRREVRPLAERYAQAKAFMLDGHFARARRLMEGFTAALNAAAGFRFHGRRPEHPRATIIVISHRDHDGVDAGLKSIARQIDTAEIEVILVDNGNRRMAEKGRALFGDFGLAEPGFNAGCSAARNIGAHHATAPVLLFLDDDGITAEGCVEALIAAAGEPGTVAVRGKVVPLTDPALTGSHYDLGPVRLPALNTTEGVSAWNRKAYCEAGGFDPLLAGHEGVELCARLWRFHGPSAFVYEPSAVLRHDYAADGAASEAKKKRQTANLAYLDALGLPWREINSAQMRLLNDPLTGYFALRKPPRAAAKKRAALSVITTAKNAQPFLAEFTQSLKNQTDSDFELVFIDDHSVDGTSAAMAALWDGDRRLKLAMNDGHGRGAGLNAAMRRATGDLCIIADADDLSVPERIAMTRSFFAANPAMDCMSFVAFNEKNPFRLGPPRSALVDDVAVRQLFGMPVSFPTFAFRRKEFLHPFSEELTGGIDCDWIFRRIARKQLAGRVVFYPAVYYREHGGQITATRKDTQLAVREAAIASAYERVIGPLDETDREMIAILTVTKRAAPKIHTVLAAWITRVLAANRVRRVFDPAVLDHAMMEGLRDVAITAR